MGSFLGTFLSTLIICTIGVSATGGEVTAAPSSRVTISDTTSSNISKEVIGTNFLIHMDKKSDLENNALKTALGSEGIDIKSLRYPGGGISQEYFWRSNCLVDLAEIKDGYKSLTSEDAFTGRNDISGKCSETHGSYLKDGTEHDVLVNYKYFMDWAYSINPNMDLTFVVNVDSAIYENKIQEYADYAAKWFLKANQYAKEKGYRPVLKWEVGNEIYHLNGASVSAKRYANVYKIYRAAFDASYFSLVNTNVFSGQEQLKLGIIGPRTDNWVGFMDELTREGQVTFNKMSIYTRKYCRGSSNAKFIEAANRDAQKYPELAIDTTGEGKCGSFSRRKDNFISYLNSRGSTPSNNFQRAWWDVVGDNLGGVPIDFIVTHIYDNSRVRGGVKNFTGQISSGQDLQKITAFLRQKGVQGKLQWALTEWNIGSPSSDILNYQEHIAVISEQLISHIKAGVKTAHFWPLRIGGQNHTLAKMNLSAEEVRQPASYAMELFSKNIRKVQVQENNEDSDLVTLATVTPSKVKMSVFILNKSASEKSLELTVPNGYEITSLSSINVISKNGSIDEVSTLPSCTAGVCQLQLESMKLYLVKFNK